MHNYLKIVNENKNKEKMWKSKNFLHKSPSFNRCFRNGIISLLRRADARKSVAGLCDTYRWFVGQALLMMSQRIGGGRY